MGTKAAPALNKLPAITNRQDIKLYASDSSSKSSCEIIFEIIKLIIFIALGTPMQKDAPAVRLHRIARITALKKN
jgi:hypothetical protein